MVSSSAITAEVVEDEVISPSIYPCSMRDALNMLGIEMNPKTATDYRQWLGLIGGARLSRADVLRLHQMWFWCQRGRGRDFSKRRFLQLESRQQIEQVLKGFNYEQPRIY